jgi:phosphoribosylaminoimidazolecarboxamide formyltransferase/IMP cyclohydrolase
MIRRAILSVSDKTGLVDFAKELSRLGVELVSTGGTAKALSDAGVPVRNVSDLTGFPECLDGRVKTLHPKIHGGILAVRSNPEHMARIAELGIGPIDLVVINLYPFKKTVMTPGADLATCIENIDIGGPSMLRAAAKNHPDVTVVTNPGDYAVVLAEIRENGGDTTPATRFRLATRVFEHTAAYDALIADYLRRQSGAASAPSSLTLTFDRVQELRYGENPHQKAVFYRNAIPAAGALSEATQVNGKELSYNNIVDTDAALDLLREFDAPTVVAVKHANPCGVGCGETLLEAWCKAYASDTVSIFGGIVAANREIDEATAAEMDKVFLEVVVAPSFSESALTILSKKKNLRLLVLPGLSQPLPSGDVDFKRVHGGLLVQDRDAAVVDDTAVKTVTTKPVDPGLEADLAFAMKVVKHVKSNAIVMAKDLQTVGIGAGQPNRITSVKIAAERAGDRSQGAVMASDAFFPFSDCVEAAAAAGIACIVQPGGSLRDAESIEACDQLGLAMRFTGMRHFWH